MIASSFSSVTAATFRTGYFLKQQFMSDSPFPLNIDTLRKEKLLQLEQNRSKQIY